MQSPHQKVTVRACLVSGDASNALELDCVSRVVSDPQAVRLAPERIAIVEMAIAQAFEAAVVVLYLQVLILDSSVLTHRATKQYVIFIPFLSWKLNVNYFSPSILGCCGISTFMPHPRIVGRGVKRCYIPICYFFPGSHLAVDVVLLHWTS